MAWQAQHPKQNAGRESQAAFGGHMLNKFDLRRGDLDKYIFIQALNSVNQGMNSIDQNMLCPSHAHATSGRIY